VLQQRFDGCAELATQPRLANVEGHRLPQPERPSLVELGHDPLLLDA